MLTKYSLLFLILAVKLDKIGGRGNISNIYFYVNAKMFTNMTMN